MAMASRALRLSRAALSPLSAAAASSSCRFPALRGREPPPGGGGVALSGCGDAVLLGADGHVLAAVFVPELEQPPAQGDDPLEGCDFEHWLVVMEPPPGDPASPDITRDDIIKGYIDTLASIVGSEEEARRKIYSVSTRHYFAFGALVSKELSYKLKEFPKVRWVLPDSYLDVKNKDYGGEPFINGEAVPYDPKYHEEWVRNNARANEKFRRNDRPHSFDRSRNFDRRRENMQNFQNGDAPPGQGYNSPPHHAQGNMPPPPPPPHAGGAPSSYQQQGGGAPGYPQGGYAPGGAPPSSEYQGGPPGCQGGNRGYQGNPGQTYQGGNPGYQGGAPGYQGGNPPPPYHGGSPNAPPPYQGGSPNAPPPPLYQGGSPNAPPPYQRGSNPGYGGGSPGYPGQGGSSNYQ